MSESKLSHDILNHLERIRVMHELVKTKNFSSIPKEEIETDLKESLRILQECFNELLKKS